MSDGFCGYGNGSFSTSGWEACHGFGRGSASGYGLQFEGSGEGFCIGAGHPKFRGFAVSVETMGHEIT